MRLRARDLMQPTVIELAPDTPFLQVQHLLVEAHISGAPIVDEAGRVLGIVSCSDLLRVVDQTCDDEIDPSERSKSAADGASLSEDLRDLTAQDVATPELVWVDPDTPISEVAAVMRQEGIHRVLVGNEQRLLGIVTAFDLLTAL